MLESDPELSDAELRKFLDGTLNASEESRVEAFLETRPEALSRLETSAGGDGFLEHFSTVATDPPEDKAQLTPILGKIKTMDFFLQVILRIPTWYGKK